MSENIDHHKIKKLHTFEELLELERQGYTLEEQWNSLLASPFLLEQLDQNPRNIVRVYKIWEERLGLIDLLPKLFHKDWFPRREATKDLGALLGTHKEAVPLMIQMLKDPSEHVRSGAVWALYHAKLDEEDDLLYALLEAIKDSYEHVRSGAAFAISRLNETGIDKIAKEAIPLLIPLLKEDSEHVRSGAKWALNTFAKIIKAEAVMDKLVESLIKGLKENQSQCKIEVVNTLGLIGKKANKAVFVLNKLLRNKNHEVRQAAEESLRKILE